MFVCQNIRELDAEMNSSLDSVPTDDEFCTKGTDKSDYQQVMDELFAAQRLNQSSRGL